ncbi:hypothetical protein TWF706_004832 [Orbilia oligospora]|nr:hypothetical protein TWF706_004832 [Orbilia oligospora]
MATIRMDGFGISICKITRLAPHPSMEPSTVVAATIFSTYSWSKVVLLKPHLRHPAPKINDKRHGVGRKGGTCGNDITGASRPRKKYPSKEIPGVFSQLLCSGRVQAALHMTR